MDRPQLHNDHNLRNESRSPSPTSLDELRQDEDAISVLPQNLTAPSTPRPEVSTNVETKYARKDKTPLLRYRKRTAWLLIFYLPLLIIPWVFICVLAVRRIDGGPYFEQSGLSPKALLGIGGYVAAADVLGSINGVATIPVMSALIAQAAVVHCQRRKVKQTFNLRQMFALADRGWSDITILWGARDTGASSPFLWFAAALITTSAIQQPLQSLFVAYAQVTVMTCLDEPVRSCNFLHFPTIIGHDPEPADLATIGQNLVVQAVSSELSSRSENTRDPYMWKEYPYSDGSYPGIQQPFLRETFYYYNSSDAFSLSYNDTYFVTALPNGTTTGILRHHAIRFNSTVKCERVPYTDFPATCPGNRPFTTSFSRTDVLDLKVCVPGEYGVNPWNLTRNRQEISEDLYFNVSTAFSSAENFTLHCTASTTRGYFELGNYRNEYRYGPLKEVWPSPKEMKVDFNDYLGPQAGFARPSEQDITSGYSSRVLQGWQMNGADPFRTGRLNMSGPLMTSAIAIFGNSSFFRIAANASANDSPSAASRICTQDKIPFSRLGRLKFEEFQSSCFGDRADYAGILPADADNVLVRIMNWWAFGFNETIVAEEAFSMAIFVANKAMLTNTVEADYAFSARPIFTSPGLTILRPTKTLPATIIVSTLIFLQLVGIAYTTWYIYQMPSWSHALDALAVARIGAGIREKGLSLPRVGAVVEKHLTGLKSIDGLIGVDKGSEDQQSVKMHENMVLALGGTGVVPKDYAKKRRKSTKKK